MQQDLALPGEQWLDDCAPDPEAMILAIRASWVAQLLSQLLHNETCRNYWSGRQWEQDCLQKLLGDTHLPSVSRLLHEGAAQWKPVTGPAAAVMPWVNRIMPSSSSAASIAIPSPEIMTNALRSTWTLNQPLPFAAHLLEVCSPSVCGDKVELAKLLEGAPVNSLAPTFRRCNLPLFYRIRNGSLQLGSTASSTRDLTITGLHIM